MEEILKVLSKKIKDEVILKCNLENITEIRIRLNKEVMVYENNKEIILCVISTTDDITEILKNVSNNSIYAIDGDIKEGFVTTKGGNRIGICGEVKVSDNKIIGVSNISSMNIRIARQILGVSCKVMKYIVKNGCIKNTLIVSPPGKGKTTLLRDIARNLSDGSKDFSGVNVGIVDERNEIASVYQGESLLNVGKRTDVLTGINKAKGIEMMIRSMGLNVIITDEIYTKEDCEAIKKAVSSGISCIFSMHGEDLDDILMNDQIADLIEGGIFKNVIILSSTNRGQIQKVHIFSEKNIKEVA